MRTGQGAMSENFGFPPSTKEEKPKSLNMDESMSGCEIGCPWSEGLRTAVGGCEGETLRKINQWTHRKQQRELNQDTKRSTNQKGKKHSIIRKKIKSKWRQEINILNTK